MILKIKIKKRLLKGKKNSKIIRKLGYIPSIIYRKGKCSFNIQLKENIFISILDNIKNNNKYNLYLLFNNKEIHVNIKKIQYHPYKNKILHIDFIKS